VPTPDGRTFTGEGENRPEARRVACALALAAWDE
jgi:hypothetical protein